MSTLNIFSKKISWQGLNLTCTMERYLETNNIALELYDEFGEFYDGITLDYKTSLPKSNNAIISREKSAEGILSALTKVDMVKVVGKIDVKLVMQELVLVNTRQFKEVEEEVFLEFAKSEEYDLNEFLSK
ncbi:hypothetical protein [Clostridium senegalense]|uniref:hypothetical protein n=2 Tax=Clostridium senegalense TaxID=1465809 RepID=UPI001C107375|nr:hypothetical protein [Clostridium senegalense]MBU5227646.1 hypothetical protein [Clostridium senegalense]